MGNAPGQAGSMTAGSDLDYTDLLGRAAGGDQGAWDTLVRRLAGRVWAVVRSYRFPRDDAEDVVQLSFLRLLTHIDTIQDPARVGAWLATTARRECLRLMQQRQRYRLVADDAEFDQADPRAPEPDAGILRAERDAFVIGAVKRLSPSCQQILRLLADPDVSYAEASEILNRPIGSLGPTRGRCLDQLRRVMGITGVDGSISSAGGPDA